ncbi:MAG: 3-deoxy-D-manno-octulosonic acid transferase [Acidobacteria bacterium]|nr:3-deoxy-D-manno-octulosonic acid transferase [Acidobacteriota bacterium]
MFLLYSFLYTIAFILMSPLLVIRRKKYASGFFERLGFVDESYADEKPVIWIHCVSVGETNAARPLIEILVEEYRHYRIAVSTTTATGQALAKELFTELGVQVFYFPFDWRFSVRRALRRIKPAIALVLETEIWPNFFREAKKTGVNVIIVNGRLSEKSAGRYSLIAHTIKRVLRYVDLALMQDKKDAKRLIQLGIRSSKVKVTGNMKFDQSETKVLSPLSETLKKRFAIGEKAPLIVAASTHEPEEEIALHALKEIWKESGGMLPRLLIAPRHPERFEDVEKIIRSTGFEWVKRSEPESNRDQAAEVILLDSIGELRDVYPLAEIVFVGGSVIRHGGQSVLEPAFCDTAIVTGANTENFAAVVKEFVENEALLQLPKVDETTAVAELAKTLLRLLDDDALRLKLKENALRSAVGNRGATQKTLEYLESYLNAGIGENLGTEG